MRKNTNLGAAVCPEENQTETLEDTFTAKEQQAHAYWKSRADEYSELHSDSYLSNERMLYAPQVALSLPAGDHINALDLGCGSGFMSLLLLDAGCQVTGVDFSEEMLEHARENVRARGYHAMFLQMKIQDLKFPDNTFDYIVSRNVTWICEDVESIYKEVMRVLKDDGVFLNLDTNYGKVFRRDEENGVPVTHPTQSLEQLKLRNDIVRDLPISLVERPQWDIDQFWKLGASEIRCRRTDIHRSYSNAGTALFALEVHGPKDRFADFETLQPRIPSQHLIDVAERRVMRAVKNEAEEEGKRAIFVDFVRVGSFEFDPRKFAVVKNGQIIMLAPKEFNILFALARKTPQVVSHADLLEAAWGSEYADRKSDLAVYVRRIREKIEDDPDNPRFLITKRRMGYQFVSDGTSTRN